MEIYIVCSKLSNDFTSNYLSSLDHFETNKQKQTNKQTNKTKQTIRPKQNETYRIRKPDILLKVPALKDVTLLPDSFL